MTDKFMTLKSNGVLIKVMESLKVYYSKFFSICHSCIFAILFILSGCNSQEQKLSAVMGVTTVVPTAKPSSIVAGLSMNIIGGNFQISAPATNFSDPLKVQLLEDGIPVSGRTVNFTFTSAVTGSLSSTSVTTDSSGMASVILTAGASTGTIGVHAVYQSASVNFTETVIDQSGVSISIHSGNTQSATVNTVYGSALKVLVTNDITTLPAPNIIVTFLVTAGNSKINSSLNTINVTTDAYGIASINLQAGTIMGTDTVKATIAANVAQFVNFNHSATSTPANYSAAHSTVDSSLSGVIANGSDTTTITFTLKDQFGNILNAPAGTVVFSATAGTLIGGVTNVGNGTYTQTWQAPATGSGTTVTISATYNAVAITDTASISLSSGTYSITNSTISASTTTVTADGTSFTTITVTLKDSLGNTLTTGGETVVISKSGGIGTLLATVSDLNNGTYTQIFRSTTATGTSNVTATVNAVSVPGSVNINFISGTASAVYSTLAATQTIIPPDNSTMTLITLVTRDTNNNLRDANSAGTPTISMTSTLGTLVGSITNNGDGTYSQYLKSSSSGTATVKAVIDGVTTTNKVYVYFNSQNSLPSTQFSQVEIVGGTSYLAADGSSTVTVKATIKTASNSQFTSGGNTIQFSTTAGTLIGSPLDNGDGTYTQILQSSNTSTANVTISATVDGSSITDTATINFYGSISLATSTISVSAPSIEGNGTSTTTLILQAKDSNSIAIPVGGAAGITFATNLGTLNGTISDNSNGTYTQVLQSSVGSGTATISANQGATPFSATSSVTFFVANNYAGVTLDCTADCGGADFSTCATSVTKRIRLWGSNVVVDGGTLTLNTRSAAGYCPNDFNFAAFIVRNSATVTHTAISNGTTIYNTEFTSTSLFVDSTSKIDVQGKGLTVHTTSTCRVPSGSAAAPSAQNTNTTWSTVATLPCNYGGGSHGGTGGIYESGDDYSGSKTYGNLFEPTDPGATGAYAGAGGPRSGGGIIKITVTGTATIDGYITADAQAFTSTNFQNGAAGGSIWLNVTTLTGTGYVSTLGSSNTTNTAVYMVPGGGGRIAIYYDSLAGNFSYPTNIFSNVRAWGGKGTGSSVGVWRYGGAGTVYMKQTTQTYGDLIINNNDQLAMYYSSYNNRPRTDIPFPTSATADAVTASTINKVSWFKDNYRTDSSLKNYFVTSNSSQNATVTKLDDTFHKITSADADNINISSGSFTAAPENGSVATTFDTALIFDRLEIRGKAHVKGPILIGLSGSISNATSVSINASFANAKYFEYQDVDMTWDTNSVHSVSLPVNLDQIPTNNANKSLTLQNGIFTIATGKSLGGLTLSGVTLTSSVAKNSNTFTLTGPLSLTNTTTITHTAASTTVGGAEYAFQATATSLNIDATSMIDVSQKGYPGVSAVNKCRVIGNQDTTGYGGNTYTYSGHSHGGYGSAGGGYANAPYGNFMNPNTAGGVCVYSTSNPNYGGGIARIDVGNGAAVIDGSIRTNGHNSGSSVTFGSSAGSIYLNAGSVSGTGYLSAIGGYGTHNAGSGGRIAVYYTSLGGNFSYPTNVFTNIRAWGATAAVTTTIRSSAGTVYLKDKAQTYGDLIVNNNGIEACNTAYRCGTNILTPSRSSISSLTSTSATYSAASIFQDNGISSDHVVGLFLVPNINQNATTPLYDNSFYKISSLSTATLNTATSGVNSNAGVASVSAFVPILRNLQMSNNGSMYLDENIIVTEGDITSNDTTTFSADGFTQGSGVIELMSGNNLVISSTTANTSQFLYPIPNGTGFGNVTVNSNGMLRLSSATTINGTVTLNSGTLNSTAALTITGDLDLTGSSIARIGTTNYNANLIVSGDIDLTGTSTLTPMASTASTLYRLYATASNLNICATCSVSATALGLPAAASNQMNVNGTIYTTNKINFTAMGQAGASHGGHGGTNSTASHDTVETFGNFKWPVELAGSCSTNGGNPGTNSGGALRISITNSIVNDGTIESKGGTQSLAGVQCTGAGGSILIETNTLSGTGSINANGGTQTDVTNTYGAGGGGRVAIYYTTMSGNFSYPTTLLTNISAYGGSGMVANTNGSAGTIFLKSSAQTYGDLVINNNNQNVNSTQSTFISTPVSSTSTNISNSNTTLTKAAQFGYQLSISNQYTFTNKWLGFYLNPKTNQNGTTTLADDTVYHIQSSDNNSVTTYSDFTVGTGAVIGDNYRLSMKLDNLEVRGKARLNATNLNILVLQGDLSSNDTTTFNQDGVINANVVDVNGKTWNATANEAGSVITNRCGVAGAGIVINCP